MYQVYDDILTKNEQEELNNIFFNCYFPFYFSNSSNQKTVDDIDYNRWADNNTVETKTMVHTFIDTKVSKFYKEIEHVIQKFSKKTSIKFFDIVRCKLNLQYQVSNYNKNNYQCPHYDQNFDHKVLIYYPYTSDGDTFLLNEVKPNNYEIIDRIKPIGGRFLLMDKMFHAGQPPVKNETRMTLNYNLIGVYK